MMLAARGAFLAARRGPELPYDAEVEYIESTGTQWIDSGIQVNSDLAVTTVAQSNSTGCWFFGGRTAFHNSALGVYSTPTSGYLEVNYGNVNPSVSYGGILQKTEYSIKQGVFYINGDVAYRYSQQPFQSISTIYIGNLSVNEQGVPSNVGLKGRIYSFEISRGDNKLRDKIPVRFTNELGHSEGAMYDRANPTVGMNPDGSPRTDGLYRNRGTGSFVIGPDKTA